MEKYLTVIKVLENWDSITLNQITSKAGPSLALSKENLNFLVKLDLIIEKTLGNKTVYSITERGRRLSKYFRLEDDVADFIFCELKIARID
jgi:predicted transcriptional regulator